MTNQTEPERFADLVDEAENALNHLERLSAEIQNYRAATDNLNGAASELGNLSQRMSDVSDELKQAGETLKTIGTQELLNAQSVVKDRVDILHEHVQVTVGKVDKLSTLVSVTLAVAGISVILGVVGLVITIAGS